MSAELESGPRARAGVRSQESEELQSSGGREAGWKKIEGKMIHLRPKVKVRLTICHGWQDVHQVLMILKRTL